MCQCVRLKPCCFIDYCATVYTYVTIIITCLDSRETTQLRRKATWEKGPTTEPRTRDLRPNAEFQPRELRNRSHSFVPHRPLCASLLSCVVSLQSKQIAPAHKEHIHYRQKRQLHPPPQACGPITIQHASASLEIAGLKRSWIRHTRDWHIRGDVGRRSVTDSVARVAETPR